MRSFLQWSPRLVNRVLVGGVLVATSIVPSVVCAQGALSSLGFGYPVGGRSTRVSGTAGAFAELDALTPQNPAALGGLMRTVLSAQAEPEYRTLRVGTVKEKTTSQRIPLIAVLFPAGRGFGFSLSANSFLDRSYTTVTTGSALINGAALPTSDRLDVRGAIGTMQGAVGWQVNRFLKVGAAGHLYTGDNVVARERTFADTLKFGSVLDSSRVVYFGSALSVGGEVRVFKGLAVTGSYRAGRGMDARIRDTVRTRANVPNQRAASVRFDGIPGTILVVGVQQIEWSRLAGLGSSAVKVQDASNWHAGAEVAGPRLRGFPLLVRAGYARTELPFSATAAQVTETRFATGLGVPVARDAASIDLSLQRANRVLVGGAARESAWVLGLGLQIRP